MSDGIFSVCGKPYQRKDFENWNNVLAPGVDEDHVYRCKCGHFICESFHEFVGVGINLMPGVRSICPICNTTVELRNRKIDTSDTFLDDENKTRHFQERHMKRMLERRGLVSQNRASKSGKETYTGLEVMELLDRVLNELPLEGESLQKDYELYAEMKSLIIDNREENMV